MGIQNWYKKGFYKKKLLINHSAITVKFDLGNIEMEVEELTQQEKVIWSKACPDAKENYRRT